MASTTLLASGNGISVSVGGTTLAQLDLTQYRAMRLTVAASAFNPADVLVAIAHVDQPNTSNANAIDNLDRYLVSADGNVSRSYDVPGQSIDIEAFPEGDVSGCTVFFTVYAQS